MTMTFRSASRWILVQIPTPPDTKCIVINASLHVNQDGSIGPFLLTVLVAVQLLLRLSAGFEKWR